MELAHLVHVHLVVEVEEGHQDVLQVQEVVEVLFHHLQAGVGEVELLVALLEEAVVVELLVVNLEEEEVVELLAVHLEEVEVEVEVQHLHLEGVEEVEVQSEHLEGAEVVVDLHVKQEVGVGVLLGQGEEVGVGVLLG